MKNTVSYSISGNDPYWFAADTILSKWKPLILTAMHFDGGTSRYHQFKNGIPVSEKVLTENLRELEADGFVTRTVYPDVPPRVEYSLTGAGESAVQLLFKIYDWAYKEMQRRGLPIDIRGAMFHGYVEKDPDVMDISFKLYCSKIQEEKENNK